MILANSILVAIFFLSVESLFWSFSINRHSVWLIHNPSYDRRLAVSSRGLAVAGWIVAIVSLYLWLWAIYSFASFKSNSIESYCFYIHASVVVLTDVSFIIMWTIIARYCCLHTKFWPILSGYIAQFLIKRFSATDINKYCSYMKKWSEIDKLSEQHKQLLFKFADTMRDLLWTKDQNRRYTYANKAMCEVFFLTTDEINVIGKTHSEIALELRNKGIAYNFDETSYKSDKKILNERRTLRFLQRGIVDGKEVILQVLKSPIFLKGELVGIIGVARDITYEVEYLEKIELLLKAGDIDKAKEVFFKYKYDFVNFVKMDKVDNFNKGGVHVE